MAEYRTALSPKAKVRVPDGELWAHLAPVWNAVTTQTIRNCFAKVPVIPEWMTGRLKTVEDTGIDELDATREDLKRICRKRAAAIDREKDFAVHMYPKSLEGRDPSQWIAKAIAEVVRRGIYADDSMPRSVVRYIHVDLIDVDGVILESDDGSDSGCTEDDVLN
ncbi:hypothetical protein EDD21DRAFT_417446 [Dissophora ornata]|nr:hypothetical protein EDD21DRAFT_417446 [Dissophora ornata]